MKRRTAWVLAAGVAAVALGAAAVGAVALRRPGRTPVGRVGRRQPLPGAGRRRRHARGAVLRAQRALREPPAVHPGAGRGRGSRGGRPGGEGAPAAGGVGEHGLGPRPGAARRPRPVPTQRQALVGAPRVRGQPGVLPRHGVREGGRLADRDAGRVGPLRGGVVLQGRPRQAGGRGAVRGGRQVQERPEPVHGGRLHGAAPRADGGARREPLRPVRPGGRRGPRPLAPGRPGARRPRAVSRARGEGGRSRRRAALPGPGRGPHSGRGTAEPRRAT